jgi:membrane protease YdiL (CAAX protease family)
MRTVEMGVWKKALSFYLKSFLFTWIWWLLPVLTGTRPITGKLFLALGGAVPLLTVLISLDGNRERKRFLIRCVDFKRISVSGYLIIILLFPLSNLVALLLYTGGEFSNHLTQISSFVQNPVSLIPFLLFMLLFGPLTEEPAWRGYVPDLVREKVSFWQMSVISALFWALWHLPLFFMEGSYQQRTADAGFICLLTYVAAFFPHAILMIRFYDRYRGSVLSAILIHWSANTWGELLGIPEEARIWRTVIEAVVVTILIVTDTIKEKNGKTERKSKRSPGEIQRPV